MNKKHLAVLIKDDHIIVYYKRKRLFKVSNNIQNAANLLEMINKEGGR